MTVSFLAFFMFNYQNISLYTVAAPSQVRPVSKRFLLFFQYPLPGRAGACKWKLFAAISLLYGN